MTLNLVICKEVSKMPKVLQILIGIILVLSTIGVATWQALLAV